MVWNSGLYSDIQQVAVHQEFKKGTGVVMRRNNISKNFIFEIVSVCALVLSILFSDVPVYADEGVFETQAEVYIEESQPAEVAAAAPANVASDLVDAPPVVPEGSAADNNIFGVAGMYYVTIPKKMAFRVLSNGDYETIESSRYTVNSALDSRYQLSVRVSGSNKDNTMQLSNEDNSIHRKVEVSTMAYDVWKYRPDGTRLTVNEADASGYGKELVLEGPGKFYAKCRLSQFGDDVIHAGTWTGSILFTVSCTPEPEPVSEDDVEDEDSEDSDSGESDEPSEGSDEPADVDGIDVREEGGADPAGAPSVGYGDRPTAESFVPMGEPVETEPVAASDEADSPEVMDDGALMDISQLDSDANEDEASQEGTSSEDLGEPVVEETGEGL